MVISFDKALNSAKQSRQNKCECCHGNHFFGLAACGQPDSLLNGEEVVLFMKNKKIITQFNGQTMQKVAVYEPKYCPNCGRKLKRGV